ncbi:hypothetical protein SAMD00019534_058140 [Acytostelium subglobosum LB1]|uniref:hypothetical protein n=1 Tax=Acytostelium subglobosum LB1 TaxID=1410327 RepID=UPI000644878E|nr:hypothetical protein SAMD00019534_058140 [Acytostelium subglobosum LB1]GAM22639.1 hypothetical protein SAMD00019534_058140 [Acytostelium subglobosum LB1]|eukprot:XP_012754759.1 hypothetical protein SAMD00019534_058140 [Acytostelium subglobosum LB1]
MRQILLFFGHVVANQPSQELINTIATLVAPLIIYWPASSNRTSLGTDLIDQRTFTYVINSEPPTERAIALTKDLITHSINYMMLSRLIDTPADPLPLYMMDGEVVTRIVLDNMFVHEGSNPMRQLGELWITSDRLVFATYISHSEEPRGFLQVHLDTIGSWTRQIQDNHTTFHLRVNHFRLLVVGFPTDASSSQLQQFEDMLAARISAHQRSSAGPYPFSLTHPQSNAKMSRQVVSISTTTFRVGANARVGEDHHQRAWNLPTPKDAKGIFKSFGDIGPLSLTINQGIKSIVSELAGGRSVQITFDDDHNNEHGYKEDCWNWCS